MVYRKKNKKKIKKMAICPRIHLATKSIILRHAAYGHTELSYLRYFLLQIRARFLHAVYLSAD